MKSRRLYMPNGSTSKNIVWFKTDALTSTYSVNNSTYIYSELISYPHEISMFKYGEYYINGSTINKLDIFNSNLEFISSGTDEGNPIFKFLAKNNGQVIAIKSSYNFYFLPGEVTTSTNITIQNATDSTPAKLIINSSLAAGTYTRAIRFAYGSETLGIFKVEIVKTSSDLTVSTVDISMVGQEIGTTTNYIINDNGTYKNYVISGTVDNPTFSTDNLVYTFADTRIIDTDNYSEKQRGVRDSLIQSLSVIKGELWYKSNFGLPLIDRVHNKGIVDSIVIDIITSNPGVKRIASFSSSFSNHTYSLKCNIISIYADEEIEINL